MNDTARQIPQGTPERVRQLAEYWLSLGDGAAPERSLLDPGAILHLLPYVLVVHFEDTPFRVRYRLTGTKVDEMTGMNITGRHLDEFATGEFRAVVEGIQRCYVRCRETGQAVIEAYHWPNDRDLVRLVWMGLFPLRVNGEVRQCISIEDYGPLGPQPDPIDWTVALKI
jgi:hypothetical protein